MEPRFAGNSMTEAVPESDTSDKLGQPLSALHSREAFEAAMIALTALSRDARLAPHIRSGRATALPRNIGATRPALGGASLMT